MYFVNYTGADATVAERLEIKTICYGVASEHRGVLGKRKMFTARYVCAKPAVMWVAAFAPNPCAPGRSPRTCSNPANRASRQSRSGPILTLSVLRPRRRGPRRPPGRDRSSPVPSPDESVCRSTTGGDRCVYRHSFFAIASRHHPHRIRLGSVVRTPHLGPAHLGGDADHLVGLDDPSCRPDDRGGADRRACTRRRHHRHARRQPHRSGHLAIQAGAGRDTCDPIHRDRRVEVRRRRQRAARFGCGSLGNRRRPARPRRR